MLKNKKIIIGITGSIAAYKIPLLVRLLVKEGAEVQTILTEHARDFVTPLTLSVLSRRPALTIPFDSADGTWHSHVDMGLWADLMLVAPASAATLSKMASGLADNLLLTTYLSAKCPVFFAPAMDLDMFKHPSTGENIKRLTSRGHKLIAPQVGELASGLTGAGRMEEPEKMLEIIRQHFAAAQQFVGKHFLITAGPTYEAIDPVRFIGNQSSGQMGFALAEAAAERGATVTLVAGPVHQSIHHPGIKRIDVVSADEMLMAVTDNFASADVTIMSAAVADFKPQKVAIEKIKKQNQPSEIILQPTVDILSKLGKEKRPDQLLIGFALETENELENALQKLSNKNLDMIVLNSLRDKGAGFGTATNKITLIDRNRKVSEYELKAKSKVAADILDAVATMV
ncbi:MAG TPA: bifunctional phosphopantothenoylcysteine decarboxylase/phosphopantothenate--cysteine ligase CoaBC [Bacteroidales bacterium]|nr:bifunctional phosphopantothenoylcysteine decarboxylase/phosphopantothenate--cysteine ligase CoaBC [Bacteroidales bacterium]